MEIKILKNAPDIGGLHIKDEFFLQTKYTESEFDGISGIHYFIFNSDNGDSQEILPDIEKYSIGNIVNASAKMKWLYFINIFKNNLETYTFSIIRYNLEEKVTESLFSFEDNIEEYSKIKRLKIFVFNDNYMILQKENLIYNAKKTYMGFFKFDLALVNFKDNALYEITDENVISSGISDVIFVSENQYIIKTGFSMLEDNRYNELEEGEASLETIGYINIGQVVSDLIIGQNKINIQTIEQAYFIKTIHYIKREQSYLIYSIVDNELKEEEVKFYNLDTGEVFNCINKDVIRESDLAMTMVLNNIPYICVVKDDDISFLNIINGKIEVRFSEGLIFNKIFNNFIILSGYSKKTLFKNARPFFEVYSFPGKELLCHENGCYIDSFISENENIYISIE